MLSISSSLRFSKKEVSQSTPSETSGGKASRHPASFAPEQQKTRPTTRIPRSARACKSLPASPASRTRAPATPTSRIPLAAAGVGIGVGTPPRTVAIVRYRSRIPHSPRPAAGGPGTPADVLDLKALAQSCKKIGEGFVPSGRKSLFQTPMSAKREAQVAFERTSEIVKSRLADVVDELGRTPEYRQLAPKDQDKLLRRRVAEAFVSRICTDNGLDAPPGKLAHASAYFAQMLGNPAGKSAKGSPEKFARQVSVAEQARGKKFLDLLVEDARRNGLYRTVDVELDLMQEPLQTLTKSAIRTALFDNWDKPESVDIGSQQACQGVTPTFLRDLNAEKHVLVQADGVRQVCKSGQQFVDFIGVGAHPNLPKVISHIANQKLGQVVRTLVNNNPQSPLRSSDGETIAISLTGGASEYCFKKLPGGRTELLYTYTVESVMGAKVYDPNTAAAFGLKPLKSKGNFQFSVRIEIAEDGQWAMANPRIQAYNLQRLAE